VFEAADSLRLPLWLRRVSEKRCWRCGAPFACGPGGPGKACWCDGLPPLAVIEAEADCLCPGCLARAVGFADDLKVDKRGMKTGR